MQCIYYVLISDHLLTLVKEKKEQPDCTLCSRNDSCQQTHFTRQMQSNIYIYIYIYMCVTQYSSGCGVVSLWVRLPGEAVFTVRRPLVYRQHVGVRGAGEHQLPDGEVAERPQPPALVQTQEPLGALDALVLHDPLQLSKANRCCQTTSLSSILI